MNAARIILDKDLNYSKLNDTINEIIKDNRSLENMGNNAYKVAKLNAEEKIYKEILKVIKKS